jgi:hypothetical protein
VIIDIKTPIVFVAHDLGAANHVIAWIKESANIEIIPCVRGPAKIAWERSFPNTPISENFNEVITPGCILISGTGWASSFEHDSRIFARNTGVKSIAVIDHWTNYRERFVFNDVEQLPNEIWVTDQWAFDIASQLFPSIKIVAMPNSYLRDLKNEILGLTPRKQKNTTNLLYVLEPIRDYWVSGLHEAEFLALDFFIKNLSFIVQPTKLKIKLRPHPSDPSGKYNKWISNHKNYDIELDDSHSLASAIAWSDIVVGCQTYAMVVASAAGKKVFSSVPEWAPRCVLPQPEIIKISKIVG